MCIHTIAFEELIWCLTERAENVRVWVKLPTGTTFPFLQFFFRTYNFSYPIFFCTQFFFHPQFFVRTQIFFGPNFFVLKYFFVPKFVFIPNFFSQNFCTKFFFRTNIHNCGDCGDVDKLNLMLLYPSSQKHRHTSTVSTLILIVNGWRYLPLDSDPCAHYTQNMLTY